MKIRAVSHTFSGIGIGCFLLGMAFKISHWPGASILKIVGAICMVTGAIIRLTPAYKNANSKTKAEDVLDS